MYRNTFIDFLSKAVTPFHTVDAVKERLTADGYTELYESDKWQLAPGGKYFVIRGGSSIIAFRNQGFGFMVCASHSDFPAFRVKGSSAMGAYVKLNTEKYGGLINYSWMDRPLSVAGRVTLEDEDGVISSRLADIGSTVFIPSVAIHLNRQVNESCKLNPAKDLIPLASLSGDKGALLSRVAGSLGVKEESILSYDLSLYNSMTPTVAGLEDEMILSPRLDNLSGVYTSLEGFLGADNADSTAVLAVFNNEEVGSDTKQGAGSTFLRDTLLRLCADEEEYTRRVASGFLVSIDNGHGKHPNSPELSDAENAPTLGGGIIVKYNANQKYTTDSVSDAIIRKVASGAGIRVQSYYTRADMLGGSTLGSISDTKVPLPSVDVGLPQLAMHSSCESLAISDAMDMIALTREFYSLCLSVSGGEIRLKR